MKYCISFLLFVWGTKFDCKKILFIFNICYLQKVQATKMLLVSSIIRILSPCSLILCHVCSGQGLYMHSLPLILFAMVSFIAGMLALLFPETLGARLPDTVEELEQL